MHANDIPEGQHEASSSRGRGLGSFGVPFVCILCGELLAYTAARLTIGNPAEHGLHGGSQFAALMLFSLATVGQLAGALVWGRFSRAPSSNLLPMVAGLVAGLTAGIVVSIWSTIDQMYFFRRDSINFAEALLGLACCGVPGGLSGSAVGALGAVVSKARRK